MAKRLVILAGLAAFAWPAVASACSIVVDHEPTFWENKARAKELLAQATLVVDGEVIEPETETTPAKIKVVRWFRGPKVDYFFSKGGGGDCTDRFEVKGERQRFVMFGGPEVYDTFMGFEPSPQRAIDRLLGSDRRKDWPYYNPDFPPQMRKR
ncbi:MAG: hypothetical protein J0J06_08465 [Sphingomonas sp.]|uniref:hypothetical protein n=1 Tax=Sphingomonas sp. TaxID=28214 RepID=UPI001AC2B414|nr:hypothetical protein [Sphingomonas sp.]MBN8815464.1 hypothetical protein [Sphingomonas sp.]